MTKPVLYFYLSEEAKKAGVQFKAPRPSDAGFDLACAEDVVIAPRAQALIPTGLHIAIPQDYVGIVKDRSSIALRGGTTGAGVIDSSYRGELKIVMFNMTDKDLAFKCGERVAQLVLLKHLDDNACEEVASLDTLGETDRNHGGFGSTGRF